MKTPKWLNPNGLWRGIRRTLGLLSKALAELEELWESMPPRLRLALIRYAAYNMGLIQPATENDFWRWVRGQRDDVAEGLRVKARYLLADSIGPSHRGDGDAD